MTLSTTASRIKPLRENAALYPKIQSRKYIQFKNKKYGVIYKRGNGVISVRLGQVDAS